MKICEKCGTQQSDSRFFCIDCGEILPDKISDAQETEIKEKTKNDLEKLYNKGDPLYVSVSDKIAGIISIIGMIVTIIFIFLYKNNPMFSPSVFYLLLFFAISAFNAFFPKILWSLEKARLSFLYNGTDDLTPSDFYFISKKITIYGLLAISILFLVLFFTQMNKLPSDEEIGIVHYITS